MNIIKSITVLVLAFFLLSSFSPEPIKKETRYEKIVRKLIWAESRGKHYAKSHLKGKQKAYTRWQINGWGLEYFNHFSRYYRTKRTKYGTNKTKVQYTMSDIRRSPRKADIVGHWLLKTAIKHYKKTKPKFFLVYAVNSYNMGYGNTAKMKFHPKYLKQIVPWEWHLFKSQHRTWKTKGNIKWYSRRSRAKLREKTKAKLIA